MKSGFRFRDNDLRHVFSRRHGPYLERLRARLGLNAFTTRQKVAMKESEQPLALTRSNQPTTR